MARVGYDDKRAHVGAERYHRSCAKHAGVVHVNDAPDQGIEPGLASLVLFHEVGAVEGGASSMLLVGFNRARKRNEQNGGCL